MTREQFIGLVEEVQGPLRRFLCVLCGGDASRADDLAQEALLKAYLSFEGFEGRARFSTWLFRIAYNCFYDWKKTVHPTCGDVPTGAVSDETPDRNFRHQKLYMAINALSDHEKATVLLFYMEGKPVKEIEAITGLSSTAIRTHLFRARRHLKAFLEKDDI